MLRVTKWWVWQDWLWRWLCNSDATILPCGSTDECHTHSTVGEIEAGRSTISHSLIGHSTFGLLQFGTGCKWNDKRRLRFKWKLKNISVGDDLVVGGMVEVPKYCNLCKSNNNT